MGNGGMNMENELTVQPGLYFKGAIVLGNGVNFGIFSRHEIGRAHV